MKTFGLECEYFVSTAEELTPETVVDLRTNYRDLPVDDCGYLLEVRGDPHGDPTKAVYLFNAAEYKVFQQLTPHRLWAFKTPFLKLPKKFLRDVLRRYGKNPSPQGSGNIYGKDYRAGDTLSRAGLHLHFGYTTTMKCGEIERTINIPINFPSIVQYLDKVFAEEIKAAKRIPGMYEFKPHGFEYRSLPNNVNIDKVIDALNHINKKLF